MRWYVSLQGRWNGPYDEHQVMGLVGAGQVDHVRAETGGAWLPIAQSPFAAFAVRPAPQAPARLQPAKPPFTGLQFVFALGVLMMAIVSLAAGWVGVLLGAGLIAWSVFAALKRKRSLVALVWRRPAGAFLAAASVALGLLFCTCGATSIASDLKRARQVEAVAEQQRAAVAEKARQRAALEQALPAKVEQWRAALAEAMHVADSAPEDGKQRTVRVAEEIDAHRKMLGDPEPAGLTRIAQSAEAQRLKIQAHIDLLQNVAEVDAGIPRLRDLVRDRSWLAADEKAAAIHAALRAIERASDDTRKFVPVAFDAAKQRKETDRIRASIAGPVAQQRKREALEEQKRRKREELEEQRRKEAEAQAQAYAALCGPKPENSAWDGSIVGLEDALKETAHDPDSIEIAGCTKAVLTGEACWVFRCKVRGRNMLGARILQTRTFSYSKALGFREVE